MFIGHVAVGLAAKKAAPRVSLGTFVLAAELPDLLWPLFLIAGIEHVRIDPGNTAFTPLEFYDYPVSHSLLTVIGWGTLLGVLYCWIRRYARGAWVLAAVVVSHWVLDAISHRADMPLVPGAEALVGLGLWKSVPASLIVEASLFILGVIVYTRATVAADRTGRISFWAFVGSLSLFWLLSAFGPPPPDVESVNWGSLAVWLFVPWAYWIDRHRASLCPPGTP